MLYDNPEFYPTPELLAEKMSNLVDMERVKYVLEPSAGKGDLLKALSKRKPKDNFNSTLCYSYSRYYKYEVDCIEKDENLASLLKGQDHNVIYDDFLDFNTHKCYDLIIMNPPFSNGDKHLMKAISLIKYGGQIVCLLNAETLKNPYTNLRKELVQKLQELDASIEYLQESFTLAERSTSVEVALIYIDIPTKEPFSLILDSLENGKETSIDFTESKDVTFYDVVKRMVQSYNYEIKVGIKLIEEYCKAKPYFYSDLKTDRDARYDCCILELKCNGDKFYDASEFINEYVAKVRYKYWYALGNRPQMTQRFTNNISKLYFEKISELKTKEFNLHNIELVDKELMRNLSVAVEDTILNLFDEFTKPHWYAECTQNIHYYNGWATNKAHKVNKKVIIPLNACNWNNQLEVGGYEVAKKLGDIEKTMDYLNDGRIGESPYTIYDELQYANSMGRTRNIDTKYFTVTFYKKGTCHLVFKNDELLKKFNIFGGQKKGWLPPNYGKKHYNELTDEEKEVVKNFHENKVLDYEEVVKDNKFYLSGSQDVLRLAM